MPPTDPRDPFEPKRNGVLSDATWQIGHDLKQLLNAAGAHLDQVHHVLTSRELAPLRRTLAEAEHLVETLLDAHRVHDTGRYAFELNEFISEREASLRGALDPQVTLNLRLFPTGGLVFASPDELDEILQGLVNNAARAMPYGGDLTITTGWLNQVTCGTPFEAPRSKRYVRLTVCDTGIEDDQQKTERVL